MASNNATRLAEILDEFLSEAKEISADDVDGLEDAIERGIENYNFDFDTDHIRGLEDVIDDRLSDALHDTVSEAVREEMKRCDLPAPDVKAAVVEALQAPEIKEIIATEVRKAMSGILSGLLTGTVPLATPVKE